MSLVVDASVAIKWVVAEDGHETALALPEDAELLAPDFVLVEAASIMWKKARRKQLSLEQAIEGLSFIKDAFALLVPQLDLIDRAVQLSFELDHSVYDCLYVACAEAKRSPLWTADRQLATALSKQSVVQVILMGEEP